VIDRRAFVAGVVALAAARVAGAQPARKATRIGLLSIAAASTDFPEKQTLESLRELGLLDGRNVILEPRYAGGDSELLARQAAELVGLGVDVILTFSAGVGVAKRATPTIPIVFGTSQDPVRAGFVGSLGRPGGNLTGVTYLTDELSAKRLALLKEVLPGASRVAVLWEPSHLDNEFKGMQAAAPGLGIELQSLEIPRPPRPDEVEGAIRAARQARADALVIAPGGYTIGHRSRIIALAAASRLPVISAWRIFADDGAVLTYGPRLREASRLIALAVDKILNGAKPAEIPIAQPAQFETVVNARAAKALGIAVPSSVLIRADEVMRA
jgi:putative tryptophan/tyrosine transport system substrate-binding protein